MYVRVKTGQAGIDKRGFWVNDRQSGLRVRLGDVSANLAGEFARTAADRRAASRDRQTAMREVRKLATRPRFGLWISREF